MSNTQAAATTTIHDILDQFREEALHNRDLGDRFERLVARYLQLDPLFADRFLNVWLWNEWPKRGKTGDIGIDLVAEERATGEFCAIQCKFYLPEHTLSAPDIDSFFAALGDARFSSGLFVSTTDKWGPNAEKRLANPSKPVNRLRVLDLDDSPVDWSGFSLKTPDKLVLKKRRTPLPHSRLAIDHVKEGLSHADRGKLIMACGTGKTYTSLCIAEEMFPGGHILFLVPSLSLLSQALREWTAHAKEPIHAVAVCSDSNIGQRKEKGDDDTPAFTLSDLSFPATTSAKALAHQYNAIKTRAAKNGSAGLTVVFSTYHSIDAVAAAQKAGIPGFDLIVCDEAHRTTGVTLMGQDESHFVKVHDAGFIKAKKRLYMTATPRLYGDDAKTKASDAGAELCSMDDPAMFGEELHRLGFGEAVGKNLLTDYKVLVLAVDEKYVSEAFQRQITNSDNELTLDDAVKITGCWNGLAKRLDHSTATAADLQGDTAHMTRAVAFSRSIKDSQAFVRQMADLIEAYKVDHPDEENLLTCELDHVDGSFNAIERNRLLDWLKAPAEPNRCRILSNARCLSEGVDVPALDAVLFLNPRNSIVDVVQSVGRVMRRASGKHYGYIILPIGIPAGIPPEEALKDNQKYKVVWQVLQALRAHDDRFNACINQIELNKKAPEQLQIIGIGGPGTDGDGTKSDGDGKDTKGKVHEQTLFHFPALEAWKDALYAKIVLKCGSRRYWEDWAKDVAKIAQRHTDRIRLLLEQGNPKHAQAFAAFLDGLHRDINPAISREEAIEMLSQHLITRPVFDALFENYTFSDANPVSRAMQDMLDALQDQALEKETAALEKFYLSVRQRVEGIDNSEGKQTVILELYNKFFKVAFQKMHKRLGIVYTPVEVVDFIIRSVDDVLKHEFKSSLSEKNVHIIDPFTGTGTFIVRLLQSGLIQPADLLRKYRYELHANEIVLLAYYIAAINIEETFHTLQQEAAKSKIQSKGKHSEPPSYSPFEGIVLTDTFQLTEANDYHVTGDAKMFPENNQRVARQKSAPIRVVISNPPYSGGQTSANDKNRNLKYARLDQRIADTYVARSSGTNKNNLYNSYIRAMRWASDRISDCGVVGFVTPASFVDDTMDGLRACLTEEFTSLYIFNLRGNQWGTSGDISRQEGGKIFGSDSRNSVAISILVRNPSRKGACDFYYCDIGDYLSREQKLEIIASLGSINGLHTQKKWSRIKPNAAHDWINLRDPGFERFIAINGEPLAFFGDRQRGVETSRDPWVYNASRSALEANIGRMIDFYNQQVDLHGKACEAAGKDGPDMAATLIDTDERKIKWTRSLVGSLCRRKKGHFERDHVAVSAYRPFAKSWLYYDRLCNEYYKARLFPTAIHKNLSIGVTSPGNRVGASALITDAIPDLHFVDSSGATQFFALYLYEKFDPADNPVLTGTSEEIVIDGYRRRPGITDGILSEFNKAYGKGITREDIFFYVYGVLHSEEYRNRFAADLKKMLPRIPLTKEAKDFQAFSSAGRELAKWHLNYETVAPYPLEEVTQELGLDPWKQFLVSKMTFAKPTEAQKAAGLKSDKTRIHYNGHLTLAGIPPETYDYIVNGKPALEWIIEYYQVTVDKKGKSGIKNDPNDWCREHDDPRYIVDLVKRVTRVSLETMKIVKGLPALNER